MDIEVEAPVEEFEAEDNVEEPTLLAMSSFKPTCTTAITTSET